MNAPTPFHAQIDDEQIEGWVVKEGRSFRAYGVFRGKQIDARGNSESGAASKWREKANHKANE